MEAHDDHFSQHSQCLFENDCDTCAMFNVQYAGAFPAECTKQALLFKDEQSNNLKT